MSYAGNPRTDTPDRYYNSCCLVDGSGNVKLVYDKTFLYETDEGWATPGEGFAVVDLPEFGKASSGRWCVAVEMRANARDESR